MNDDPRRDPHQRASRLSQGARQLLSQERAAAAHVEQVEATLVADAKARGARIERIMDELLITFPNLPQAYHVGTYVLQRHGERYPCAHCTARTFIEAMVHFQEQHGPVRMDEVRRTR